MAQLNLVDEQIAVGVDADVGGNVERALDDAARIQLGVFNQRARRGQRERPAGADRRHVVFRLDHIAVAGDDEDLLLVAHQQQRLEAPQVAVGAPVLGELDGGAGEIAMLLELALEALEQRKGIGRAAGEPGEHLVAVQAPHLAGVALHDGVAEGDLAVAAHGDRAVAADRQDGRAVGIECECAHRTPV